MPPFLSPVRNTNSPYRLPYISVNFNSEELVVHCDTVHTPKLHQLLTGDVLARSDQTVSTHHIIQSIFHVECLIVLVVTFVVTLTGCVTRQNVRHYYSRWE